MKIGKTTFQDITKPINEFKKQTISGTLNVFSLTAVSMVWGHMLGLLNLWFLPLTGIVLLIGYGSEINKEKLPQEVQDATIEV